MMSPHGGGIDRRKIFIPSCEFAALQLNAELKFLFEPLLTNVVARAISGSLSRDVNEPLKNSASSLPSLLASFGLSVDEELSADVAGSTSADLDADDADLVRLRQHRRRPVLRRRLSPLSLAVSNTRHSDHTSAVKLQGKRMDTFKICKLLLRWVRERSPFLLSSLLICDESENSDNALPRSYEHQQAGSTLAQQLGITTIAELEDSNVATALAHDVDQLLIIEEKAETLLETRNVLAHKPLSLSADECHVAINAARAILDSVSSVPLVIEGVRVVGHRRVKMRRDTPMFRLFIVLRLIFILERTVVAYIRQLQDSDKIPSSEKVGCVATLCEYLKKEQTHGMIFRATGYNPRPLTLKRKIDPVWLTPGNATAQLKNKHCQTESSPMVVKEKDSLKSHIDLVLEARQAFNHDDISLVTDNQVREWIQSTIVLLRFPSGRFDQEVEQVEALAELLDASSSLPTSIPSHPPLFSHQSSGDMLGHPLHFHSGEAWPPTGADDIIEVVLDDSMKTRMNDSVQFDSTGTSAGIGTRVSKVRLMKSAPHLVVGREEIRCMIYQRVTYFLEEVSQRREIMARDANPTLNEELQTESLAGRLKKRIVVLSGHSGMGKSTVAVKAAKEIEANHLFECYFWVPARSVEVLGTGLLDMISLRGSGVAAATDYQVKIQEIIKIAAEVAIADKCFIVFDDVTHQTIQYIKELLTQLEMASVGKAEGKENNIDVFENISSTFALLTTKCVFTEEELSSEWIIPIPPLEPEDSFTLLKVIVNGENLVRKQSTSNMQQRRKLVEEMCSSESFLSLLDKHVGNSPLGLSILAQLLLNTKSVDAVIAHFETDYERVGLVKEEDVNVFGGKHFGLEVSLYQLLKTTSLNRPLALQILYACSILSPAGIPLQLLNPLPTTLLAVEDGKLEQAKKLVFSLDTSTQIDHESDEEREERQQRDRMEVRVILDELYSCGIIEIARDRNALVIVPQLTQRALRYILVQFFGINPRLVRRAIARGVLQVAMQDPLLEIDISMFASREEAILWLECMLSSRFSEQVVAEGVEETVGTSIQTEGWEELSGQIRRKDAGYDSESISVLLLAINLFREFQPTSVPEKLANLFPASMPPIVDSCLATRESAEVLIESCGELAIPIGYVLKLCQDYTDFLSRQKSAPIVEIIFEVADSLEAKSLGNGMTAVGYAEGDLASQSGIAASLDNERLELSDACRSDASNPNVCAFMLAVPFDYFRLRWARTLWETGKQEMAEKIWTTVRAETSSTKDPNAYVVATYYLAYVHYFRLEVDKATAMLEKALDELKTWNPRWQTKLDNFFMVLVLCKLDMGDPDGALQILYRSLAHLLDHCSPNNMRVGFRYGYIGDAYSMLGEYEAAEAALMEFDRIMKREFGGDAYAEKMYFYVVTLYQLQHRYDEALALVRDVLKAMLRVKRPFPYVAPMYLAEIETLLAIGGMKALVEAKSLCGSFIELHRMSSSSETKMSDSFWCMCAIYLSRCHYMEAIQRTDRGPRDSSHQQEAMSLLSLATIHSTEALAALKRAYNPKMKRADRTRLAVLAQHACNLQEAINAGFFSRKQLQSSVSLTAADDGESFGNVEHEDFDSELLLTLASIKALPTSTLTTADLGVKSVCGLVLSRAGESTLQEIGAKLLREVLETKTNPNGWYEYALHASSLLSPL